MANTCTETRYFWLKPLCWRSTLLPNPERVNEQAEADMQWLQGLIGAVRNIRGEMGLGNARLLPVLATKHHGS